MYVLNHAGASRSIPRARARVSRRLLFAPKLAHIQFVVWPTIRQQLLVRAALDDLAGLEHQHLVGVLDRAEPMRDHKASAPFQQLVERTLDQALGARVDAGCRLI